jgi:ElaB/YqjD/DUF883 family membrane-anchored ribosome-binding protein
MIYSHCDTEPLQTGTTAFRQPLGFTMPFPNVSEPAYPECCPRLIGIRRAKNGISREINMKGPLHMDESAHERSLLEQLEALKQENKRLKAQLNQQEPAAFQLDDIKEWLKALWRRIQGPLDQVKAAAEPKIKEKPITALLIAFGAGFIISRLIGRR